MVGAIGCPDFSAYSLKTSTTLLPPVLATSFSAGGVGRTTDEATLSKTLGSTPVALGPSLRNLDSRLLEQQPDRGPGAGRCVSKKRAAREPERRSPDVPTIFCAKVSTTAISYERKVLLRVTRA